MTKLFSEETLAHYGIPGQKKGIRRWQYPDGRFNEEGKIRYFGKSEKQDYEGPNIYNIGDSIKISEYVDKINKKFKIHLFDNKNLKFQYNELNKYIDDRRKNEKFDEETGLFLKHNNDNDYKNDIINNNPYYFLNKGFRNNCPNCSISYVLRRAGYDSIANYNKLGIDTGDSLFLCKSILSDKNIKDSYTIGENISIKEAKIEGYKNLKKILSKLKEKEVSIISAYDYKKNMGHYFNAEKIKGKIHIIDTQTNSLLSDYIFNLNDNENYNENVIINSITNIDTKNLKIKKEAKSLVHSVFKGGYNMHDLNEETLAHYGIQGQKKGVRRWQYPDGRFNEEGKERYFGKNAINTRDIINKGKNIINMILNNDKKINIKIGYKINKEIQTLMLNKNKYSKEEFNKELYDLVNQKNIYNNNLKPKQSWGETFSNTFSQTTARLSAVKLGQGLVDFILGSNNKH